MTSPPPSPKLYMGLIGLIGLKHLMERIEDDTKLANEWF